MNLIETSVEKMSLHYSVMLRESILQLGLNPKGIYVDATFGRGGHSRAMLNTLGPEGRLIALDRDPEAVDYGLASIQDPRFNLIHSAFSDLKNQIDRLGLAGAIEGILLDLGVSSPQLDQAERGFSFMREGPLDMRMNTLAGITAAEWLATVEEKKLADLIFKYGEERFSRRIAKAIVVARQLNPIETTGDLVRIIETAIPMRERSKHPATRTFQAIRIVINQELAELEAVLNQALEVLAIGGRLVVISFHSLEDRIVKQFMKAKTTPPYVPKDIPLKGVAYQTNYRLVGKAIKPTEEEIKENPRSRSAILRTLEKLK